MQNRALRHLGSICYRTCHYCTWAKLTKQLHDLQKLDKTYIANIKLGTETDSYDIDGKIVKYTQ